MKTKKWALTFLAVFAGMVLFTAQSALGGCEVSNLDLDPLITGNAPGTKLEGPITIFYQPVDGTSGFWDANMYWFLRLRHGSKFYSFADGPEVVEIPTDLLSTDEGGVPFIIGNFFINTVIPALYPGCDEATPPDPGCPNVVLKSYDMDVDWDAQGDNGGLFFFIADIVIAIQD